MGCLGDQSAALVGQKGFSPGMAKNTYGTGCFLLYNVGDRPVISQHGLLATVAYNFDGKAVYALEGSIAVAGSGIKFLQNNLTFFNESKEVNDLASSVPDNGGCVFVTAFSGLFAPYWIDDAKGTIFGLTQYTQKGHIARATLEATCYQTKAILDAMQKDSGHALSELAVDGGMSNSDLAMQIQADLISIPVYRPKMRETTALGAAIAAGLAVGMWRNFAELRDINRAGGAVFEPKISRDEGQELFARWEKAVNMCRGWINTNNSSATATDDNNKQTTDHAPTMTTTVTTAQPDTFMPRNTINKQPVVTETVVTELTPPEVNGFDYLSADVVTNTAKPFPFTASRDMEGADEEDLILELRKLEILQQLKRMKKMRGTTYV